MGAVLTVADLRGDRRRLRRERVVRRALAGAAAVSLVVSALIVWTLVSKAVAFLAEVDPADLWSGGWFPRRSEFDLRPLVTGTLLTSGIAMLVAAPLGLGAAVYLSEYAPPGVRRALKPALEILAGIPSVVLGFFALNVVNPELVQRVFGDADRQNLLAAGIGVGILCVPIVASISEDALRAVPRSLREAAYGLGSRRAAVSARVVVPAAVSGIVAAFVIAVSRAIGETLVVTLAAGASNGSALVLDPREPGLTMTAAMATLVSGTDRVVGATADSLYLVGALLFAVTMTLNLVGQRFVRRVRHRY
ncbi:MAG TPA: phosphate ABC transporter permease subunit PstC [Acidimicrobiales bacterium]